MFHDNIGMKIFKKPGLQLKTGTERVSFYVFCAICSIVILACIAWAVVRQTNYHPSVLTEFVDNKLKFLNAKTIKIKNSGMDFSIYLYSCDVFGVKVPKILVNLDLMEFFLQGNKRIKQLTVELDEITIEKKGDNFFVVKNENATENSMVTFDSICALCELYDISEVKIQSKRVFFKNQGANLNFNNTKITCNEKIHCDTRLKIGNGIESKIICNFDLQKKHSSFDIILEKIPFKLIKSIANLEDKLNFIGDNLSSCKFDGKIIDANNLIVNFDIILNDDSVKIGDNKIYYNSLKIVGKYDSGILDISKILLKSKDSFFNIDDVKICDEGIFFNSKVNFSGVNENIISSFLYNLRLKNNIFGFLKIKNGEVELSGLLSQKLHKSPYIKSGKINFVNSKILLSQDFVLDSLVGNMTINSENSYKINCSFGCLNKINNLNKIIITSDDNTMKVQMTGVYDAKYISNLVTENDLGGMLNFGQLTGILRGNFGFDVSLEGKKVSNFRFSGNGNFSYNDSDLNDKNNSGTTIDMVCDIETDGEKNTTKGRIIEVGGNAINFNFEKLNNNVSKTTYTGSCSSWLLNKLFCASIFNGDVDIVNASVIKNFNNICSKFVLNVKESDVGIARICNLKRKGENGLINIECNSRLQKNNYRNSSEKCNICDKTLAFSLNAKNSEVSGKLAFDGNKIKNFSINIFGEKECFLSGKLKNDIWDLTISGNGFSLLGCDVFAQNINFDLAIDINKFQCQLFDDDPFMISGFWKKRGKFVQGADISITTQNGGKMRVRAVSNDSIAEIKMQSSNVQKILRMLGLNGCDVIGDATVSMVQNKMSSNVSGDFSIENCIVKNNETLKNMIALVDSYNRETQSVIGFVGCSGDFEIDKNFENLNLINCRAKGPLLNITTMGRINLSKKMLDIRGDFSVNSDEKMKKRKKYKIFGTNQNPSFKVM